MQALNAKSLIIGQEFRLGKILFLFGRCFLYGIAFTIKMSYKGSHKMDGYFEYVVPPLEGLWHQKGVDGVDYAHKETFEWTSMIRLPEFVTPEAFD